MGIREMRKEKHLSYESWAAMNFYKGVDRGGESILEKRKSIWHNQNPESPE